MAISLTSQQQYPFHVMLIPSLRSCNFANLLSLVMCTNEGKDEALQSISACGQTGTFRDFLGKMGVLWGKTSKQTNRIFVVIFGFSDQN